MGATQIYTEDLAASTVQRSDIDITTAGQAVNTKALPGSGMSSTYTGADPGTGDVTLSFSGNVATEYTLNSKPATPASGVTVFTRVRADRRTLSQIDIYGNVEEFQKDMGRHRAGSHECSWNNTSFTSSGLAGSGMTATGTVAGLTPSFTNFKNSVKRVTITSSASTAGSNAGIRYSSGRYLTRTTGFSLSGRFGLPATMPSPYIFFCGVLGSTTQLGGATDPSSQVDIVGIGKDSADTNFFFIYNDGSGTATKVDTGITPSNTTMYIATVACNAGDNKFYISIEDMETGLVTETTTDTVNISSATTLLSFQMGMGNSTATVAAAINYGGFYGINL